MTHVWNIGNARCFVYGSGVIEASCSAAGMHADTKLHTTSHNEKKLLAQEAHSSIAKANTQKKTPCLSHPTSKCHRWGRPGLYWDWCEATFPLWYTIRWWGARGFVWSARSLWGPSVWEMLRRLAPPPVEEMDLLQVSLPAWTNYQSDAHTRRNMHG